MKKMCMVVLALCSLSCAAQVPSFKWLTGASEPPVLTCSETVNNGVAYVSGGGRFYFCSNAVGSYAWTFMGGGSGPQQTCNASLVPDYAPAVCVLTLTSADLLQFDSTSTTAVQVIGAPVSGKVLAINYPQMVTNYVFGTLPYSSDTQLFAVYGASPQAVLASVPISSIETSDSQSNVWVGVYNYEGFFVGTVPFATRVSNVSGQPFSVYIGNVLSLGPVATWSLVSGGIADGVNTSQITSGSEGTLWSNGDSFTLPCGATFVIDTTTGGAITTYHATAIGAGCTVGNAQDVTAVSGTGIGAKIDVLTIGAGYRAGDTLNDFNFIASCGVAFHVGAVDGNGLVTSLVLDNPGLGCFLDADLPLNGASPQPGIGSGVAIAVLTVAHGDGTVVLTIPYTVVPVAVPES